MSALQILWESGEQAEPVLRYVQDHKEQVELWVERSRDRTPLLILVQQSGERTQPERDDQQYVSSEKWIFKISRSDSARMRGVVAR